MKRPLHSLARSASVFTALFALSGLNAPTALAASFDEDEGTEESAQDAAPRKSNLDSLVRVVQQRPILKSGRFELFLGAGITANDVMHDHWFATATGRVHLSEWISIGASYSKFFASDSQTQRDLINDFELFPELSELRWYAGGDVSFVALDGKFLFFDSAIAYWDLYLSIGGGVTVTSRSEDPKPTGMVGVGMRLFLGDWVTFSAELRNYMFFEEFRAGDEFVNNTVGQIGFTFFIPFGFDYEYVK